MGVCAERDSKGARQSEIGELEHAVLVDQQVLRLEVAVDDAVRVAVGQALEQLVRVRLHEAGREGARVHVLFQVEVQELKDEEQAGVRVHNVQQRDDVGVAQLAQQRDLADGGGGHALVLGLEPDLLEGDCSAGGLLACFVDDAVRAFANLLEHVVVVHLVVRILFVRGSLAPQWKRQCL